MAQLAVIAGDDTMALAAKIASIGSSCDPCLMKLEPKYEGVKTSSSRVNGIPKARGEVD